MAMFSIRPKNILLPLALLAIVAPGITFFGSSWTTARWAFIALLALHVFFSRAVKTGSPQPGLIAAIVAYVFWCMLTYGWSTVPALSGMKIVALAIVVLAFFSGGYQWIAAHTPERGIDFLWPWSVVALAAWASGTAEQTIEFGDGFFIHYGSTANPNFLGLIVAASMPVIFLKLNRSWVHMSKRIAWGAILAVYIFALYQSGSRASYLLAISIACGLFVGQSIGRLVLMPMAVAVIAAIVSVAAPVFTDSFVQRNIYKNPESGNVFANRENEWEASLEAAVEGGLFGLGYGVTYGQADFGGGLTAVNYGREKGNTQLAVVEETGLVGLALYTAVLGLLFLELAAGFLATRNKDRKVMLGIVIGTLFGMTAHSVFEAWWVAPGSVEFGFFWAMAGAGCAMAMAARAEPVPAEASPRRLTRPGWS